VAATGGVQVIIDEIDLTDAARSVPARVGAGPERLISFLPPQQENEPQIRP
jgi:hypothetical protein